MLFSYLKIAWKVWQRRKFFTAISLFGISFTLMIVLVVYAMFDFSLGSQMPERRTERLLFVNRMKLLFKTGGSSNSDVGYAFLQQHVSTLRTPQTVSLLQGNYGTAAAYRMVLKFDLKRVDAAFWQVLDFDFLAGRPFNQREVRDADHVAVINEATARRYFGTVAGAVGQVLELDAVRYRVLGVVRNVPVARFITYADVWVPITTTTDNLHDPNYQGSYQAIILARQAADVPAIQQEFAQVVRGLPVPDPQRYGEVCCYARTFLESFTGRYTGDADADGGASRFVAVLLGLGLLFMLLPALNLVNINVSRTLERSSEIGVRKAFGATAGRLVGQFLVENIFLTLLGGLLGLGLAAGVLHLLNGSHFIAYSQFGLNGHVFGAALAVVLVFGILSGAYPAYKMSRLQAVKALKGDAGH